MGLIFYDMETTGKDTAFDQILQFAAILTDKEFKELDHYESRCQLLPHVVPAPGAMRVTGIRAAQLIDSSLPSHYEMVCQLRKKLLEWSPAIFVGHNSIEFDERLLRQALYMTLHPPYLTNTNGNCRSDAMKMVQAASLFAPNALTFPLGENGKPSFKLPHIAPANGFTHERAHDALADVEATIHICRTLAEKAPKIWSAFMRFSQKAAVANYVSAEQIFCFSEFYFGKPYSWLVTAIGTNPEVNSECYVYDLSIDPKSLIGLSEVQLANRLGQSPKPVRRLKTNACPIIMPADSAPQIAQAAKLGADELARRAEYLRANNNLRETLIAAFQSTKKEREASPYVEQQLYDGFFRKEHELLMDEFHSVPWDQRIAVVDRFRDERLKEIGQRLIHIERPDLLPAPERMDRDRQAATRIAATGDEIPWLTLPKALQEIKGLLAQAEPVEVQLFHEHKEELLSRLEAARLALGDVECAYA